MRKAFHSIKFVAGCAVALMATACNGIFDDVYDERPSAPAITEGSCT